MNRRQKDEAAQRFEDRRRREDQAQRLHDVIPGLQTLRLELDEYREDASIPSLSHTRVIVVPRAPALFDVPCGIKDCEDGGYDVTREVMSQLRLHTESFEGESVCYGRRAGGTCRRKLKYRVAASYAAAP